MKIRFLKQHQQYQQGDVVDLPVSAASKLLWRKLAENVEAPEAVETIEVAAEPAPVETAAMEPPEEAAVARTFLPRRRRIKVDE